MAKRRFNVAPGPGGAGWVILDRQEQGKIVGHYEKYEVAKAKADSLNLGITDQLRATMSAKRTPRHKQEETDDD